MVIIQDFSDIHDAVYNKALYHITNNEYLQKDESGDFKLADNAKEIAGEEMKTTTYPFSSFWLEFSLGTEYLAKAVLIKHQVDIFTNKSDKYKPGSLYASKEIEKGFKNSANSNTWLSTLLEEKEIEFVKQLNTGTLGNIWSTHVSKLYDKEIITKLEFDAIKYDLKHLATHRRNNDMHFYFKNNNFMTDADVEKIYIPLVNLLVDVYNR